MYCTLCCLSPLHLLETQQDFQAADSSVDATYFHYLVRCNYPFSKQKQPSLLQNKNSLRMGQTVKVNPCETSVGGGIQQYESRKSRPGEAQAEPSEN